MVIERLGSNAGLACFNVIGLLLTVALMCPIPLYAEGVNEKLLHEELASRGNERFLRSMLLFRYHRTLGRPLDLRTYETVYRYLAQAPSTLLGFPMRQVTRLVGSDTLNLFPSKARGNEAVLVGEPIDKFSFGYVQDVPAHIQLVVGSLPSQLPDPDGPVEVLVTEEAA